MIATEEIRLRAMANLPVMVAGFAVSPLLLREIIDMGYAEYNECLSVLCIRKDQLIAPEYLHVIPESTTVVDILLEMGESPLLDKFFHSLSRFLRASNLRSLGRIGLDVDGSLLSIDDLKRIVRVIQIQNGIEPQTDDDLSRLSERARQIKRKMISNQQKINELKQASNKGEELTFLDLISILCANANGINVFNVFDMNMFQFNNQFNRMKLLDDYEINVQALLHGADANHIELKHWMSRL